MEMAASPRTVEEIFKDYSGRRAGVVRALTYGALLSLSTITLSLSLSKKMLVWPLLFLFYDSDVDEFYGLCDPGIV